MAENDSSSKTRLKRTRTGCLKCRARRRKCDEEKPSCQRCVSGGFACQYGTKLSFLDKNAITADFSKLDNRQGYSTLRFVDTRSVRSESTSAAQPKQSHWGGSPSNDDSTPAVTGTDVSLSDAVSRPEVAFFGRPTRSAASVEGHTPVLNTPVPVASNASPSSAAYETALKVLMSLGTGAGHENAARASTPEVQTGVEGYFPALLNASIDACAAPATDLTEPFSTCALLPQDTVLQLLRHYRYNIAPCLDMGDPAQTFGLEVPRLAMSCTALLESMLSLSAASLNRHAVVNLKDVTTSQAEASEISLVESLIIIAFAGVQQFTASSPREWQSPFCNIGLGSMDPALAHRDFFNVRLGVSWVMLRLDVTVGLLNSTAVSIPSLLSFGVTSPAASQLFHDTLKLDRDPMLLCGQVLNYCYGQDPATTPNMQLGLGTTHIWKSLSESLMIWYNNRTREFKPMLELDENEQLFPLILFSSGTATLANQMFHTAMLLLLQNQPRTLVKKHGQSVTMSPLWHAQRICGISLNNDSRNSWDFCMIGSLFVAARRMTYEPQQQAILAGISRISRITRWDLGSLKAQLVQEWPTQ